MNKLKYNGKAIYQPSGKAAEYSEWACNFYTGCSNRCTYCYLKKGRGAKVLGGDIPILKKCFKDENHALNIFEKELKANLYKLQKKGLFFSFTTDPMLPRTMGLTLKSIKICVENEIPVKILTKETHWVEKFIVSTITGGFLPKPVITKCISFGFTLTGHDELEPHAAANHLRISAMANLHNGGFKTFASIEPVIDFANSFEMIEKTIAFCDLYKIGLESGKKYDLIAAKEFYERVNIFISCNSTSKIYWKESFRSLLALTKETAEAYHNFQVSSDYNIFKV